MTDNSCSNLEQKYTEEQLKAFVHAAAMMEEAFVCAIQAIGTPSATSSANIAAIAKINFSKAIQPFNHMLPEFLRHG